MGKASKMIEEKMLMSDLHIQEIWRAISILGRVNPPKAKDIQRYLQNEKRKEIEQREWRTNLRMLSHEQLEQKVKENVMSRRTMFRGLENLEKEGLIVNENGNYSIRDYLREELRTFGPQFAGMALSNLMEGHYPLFNRLEQNIDELIKIFGVYSIYCFMEAARPYQSSVPSYRWMSTLRKTTLSDKLASFWIQNVFSPLDMYNYFLAAIENQLSDKEVKNVLKKNFKKTKNSSVYINDQGKEVVPPSTQQFVLKRLKSITSDFDYDKYVKVGKPLYELDAKIIEKISDILERKYGNLYRPLLEISSSFVKGPKGSTVERLQRKEKNGTSK